MSATHERTSMTRPCTTWHFIALFALMDMVLLSFYIFQRSQSTSDDLLKFRPDFSTPVAMRVGHTQHYNLDEPDADVEWSKLIPEGGHSVFLKDEVGNLKPYTVTMLHQFQCLNIIRKQYNGPPDAPLSASTLHCINYLRQSILCNLNIGLESATNVWGTVAKSADYVCRDWTELYRAVEQNHAAFRGGQSV